jgi:hypothetical protein
MSQIDHGDVSSTCTEGSLNSIEAMFRTTRGETLQMYLSAAMLVQDFMASFGMPSEVQQVFERAVPKCKEFCASTVL